MVSVRFDGRKSNNAETIAVLDVGSSKVVCFIGRADTGGTIHIVGAGYHASNGLKNGVVVDMDAAEATIRAAVEKAEKEAGIAISSVVVNVATQSLQSRHLHVETKFFSAEVADRDLRRVIDTALMEFDDPDNAILHALPLNWTIDNERGIRDPRGMFGRQLGVDMHFVSAGIGVLRNLAHCIEKCHLRIADILVSPYAAGIGVLVEDEFDLGVTVVDMGAGITTAAVFRDRTLAYTDSIGLGGHDITEDIARELTTPFEAAERIKSIYGSALESPQDHTDMIPCPPMGAQDELHHEPRARLTALVKSRTEEILGILHERFVAAGIEDYAGRRVVLTGGGSLLTGMPQLAELQFQKRVRIGRPHGLMGLPDTMSGPEFAVAAGLLKQILIERREATPGPPDLTGQRYRKKRYAGGGIARSFKWLRENF